MVGQLGRQCGEGDAGIGHDDRRDSFEVRHLPFGHDEHGAGQDGGLREIGAVLREPTDCDVGRARPHLPGVIGHRCDRVRKRGHPDTQDTGQVGGSQLHSGTLTSAADTTLTR